MKEPGREERERKEEKGEIKKEKLVVVTSFEP